VDTRCEDVIEKITSAAGPVQLVIGTGAELDRRPEKAVALAPQAQVSRGDQGVSGRRVAPLLGGIDEVESGVAGHERHLGDRLHSFTVPAIQTLPVRFPL
jgi:hypothetical protein